MERDVVSLSRTEEMKPQKTISREMKKQSEKGESEYAQTDELEESIVPQSAYEDYDPSFHAEVDSEIPSVKDSYENSPLKKRKESAKDLFHPVRKLGEREKQSQKNLNYDLKETVQKHERADNAAPASDNFSSGDSIIDGLSSFSSRQNIPATPQQQIGATLSSGSEYRSSIPLEKKYGNDKNSFAKKEFKFKTGNKAKRMSPEKVATLQAESPALAFSNDGRESLSSIENSEERLSEKSSRNRRSFQGSGEKDKSKSDLLSSDGKKRAVPGRTSGLLAMNEQKSLDAEKENFALFSLNDESGSYEVLSSTGRLQESDAFEGNLSQNKLLSRGLSSSLSVKKKGKKPKVREISKASKKLRDGPIDVQDRGYADDDFMKKEKNLRRKKPDQNIVGTSLDQMSGMGNFQDHSSLKSFSSAGSGKRNQVFPMGKDQNGHFLTNFGYHDSEAILIEKKVFRKENSLPKFLSRFGYGVLENEPELWKNISLDHPVYFQNTYIGGDASLKYYKTLVSKGNSLNSWIHPDYHFPLLHSQPYDPPVKGAMELYSHLDRNYIDGKSRIFLQIGLKGTDQFTWRQPPMTVVILDLLPAHRSSEAEVFVQSLLPKLDFYDRVGLINEEVTVPVSSRQEFKRFLRDHSNSEKSSPRDQETIWREVIKAFSSAKRENSMQNKRLFILAEKRIAPFFTETIHELLLQEINSSVISWSFKNLTSHMETAQAGEGNLHYVENEIEIAAAARAELKSLEKVVARSLRLSIQLSRGVKLIQIIGSRPLGEPEKKRVKQAEIAVDRKLARTLGIETDRGDDDPGLQTIIPYFYGSDEHIVILELETDRSGAVADIKLKYKDMVEMRNETLHTAVSLQKNPQQITPRQHTIAKNIVGLCSAQVLQKIQSDHLRHQDKLNVIRKFREDLQLLPEFYYSDPDVVSDVELISQIEAIFSETTEIHKPMLNSILRLAELSKNISSDRGE